MVTHFKENLDPVTAAAEPNPTNSFVVHTKSSSQVGDTAVSTSGEQRTPSLANMMQQRQMQTGEHDDQTSEKTYTFAGKQFPRKKRCVCTFKGSLARLAKPRCSLVATP